MVTETGRGWQIPVKGLGGNISKIELFDYNVQKEKIIEIQGPKHYLIAPGSVIFHDKLQREITYVNRGTNKVWDVNGQDYHEFVDQLCNECNVTSRKKPTFRVMQDRFVDDPQYMVDNNDESNLGFAGNPGQSVQ